MQRTVVGGAVRVVISLLIVLACGRLASAQPEGEATADGGAPVEQQPPPVLQEDVSQQPIYGELLNEEDALRHRVHWFADHRYYPAAIADPNAQMFYMGFYFEDAVRFTRAAEPEDESTHLFWDVGFGESFPIVGLDYARDDADEPAGFDFAVVADTHMLLDFNAESAAVLDTDFRIGGALEGRGLPFIESVDFIGWRARGFHESTHLGDEFVIGAIGQEGFERINVSYEAVEAFLTAGGRTETGLAGFLYGGYRRLLHSPYEVNGRDSGRRNEFQFGGEARFPIATGDSRYWPRNLVVSYDGTYRHYYSYTDASIDHLSSVHSTLVAGAEWFNVRERGPTLRALLRGYSGSNPRGQLRDQRLAYVGFLLQLDY